MSICLPHPMLVQYFAGRLPSADAERVTSHVEICPSCEEALVQLAQAPSPIAPTDSPEEWGLSPPGAPAWTPPPFFDEFRLLRMLGQGGMGTVWLGHDTQLVRPVAVKFIAAAEPEPAARERFLIEARAIARLSHPNVVTVYRIGEVQGRPYLVSEFVRGTSLAQLPKPVPWERAHKIAIGLSRGLSAAHQQGVLHRDIKPANIMLMDGDEVKLLDFGLAKLVDSLHSSDQLDKSEVIVGTPRYMAPEVRRGQPGTRRSDVYSLGLVLYELCAGALPEEGEGGELEPLGRAALGVEPRLADLIDRCLRRDAAARPASGEELEAALAAGMLRESGASAQGDPSAQGGPSATSGVPSEQRTRRPFGAAAVIGGALLLLAGALGAYLRPAARSGLPGGMVLLGGGAFTMGSSVEEVDAAYAFSRRSGCALCERSLYEREQPPREVRLSPFYLDATEVKNEDFAAWLNSQRDLSVEGSRLVKAGGVLLADLYAHYGPGGLRREGERFLSRRGQERVPAVQVTWDAAQRYCADHGGRLPTEAEWEFAARGTTRRGDRFPWGEDVPRCEGVVFGRAGTDASEGAACPGRPSAPEPVGSAAQDRTPEGIWDLGGNVAEWVQDRFLSRYPDCGPDCRDPVVLEGPTGGAELRVQRGGAWFRGAEACRAAGRAREPRDRVVGDVGFRCARSAAKP